MIACVKFHDIKIGWVSDVLQLNGYVITLVCYSYYAISKTSYYMIESIFLCISYNRNQHSENYYAYYTQV